MGTKRGHSHRRPWLTKVSLKCLLRPQHAVPSTRQQTIKVPGSLTVQQQTGCLWTSSGDVDLREQSGAPEMWREWRAGARLLLCARRRKSAPLQELRGRRGAKIAFFSKGPAPQGGCLCSAHRLSPSLREEENPAPGACILQDPQSRSNLNDSLKVEGGGHSRKGAGARTQRDVLSAPTPPAKLTSAHSATGSRTRSKSVHEPLGPAGLTGLSREVARREAGRKEESDLQSHTSCLHAFLNVAGEECALAPPLPVTTARAARPKPPGEPRSECPDHQMQ